MLIFNGPFFGLQSKEYENVDTSGEMILARLSRAMAELTALKSQNEELRILIQNYIPLDLKPSMNVFPKDEIENNLNSFSQESFSIPNKDFELSRRSLNNGINELWNYVHSNSNSSLDLLFVKELKNNLLYDLGMMGYNLN